MDRRQRLALAALVGVVAGAAGGLAGWLFPWAASALVAVALVVVVVSAVWLRRQFADLRRRLVAERKALDRIAQLQHKTSGQLKGVTSTLSSLDRSLNQGLARTESSLDRTERSLARSVDKRGNAVKKFLAKTASLEGERTRRHTDRMFRQLEALQNLHQLIEVRGSVSPSRGWALSPDLLLTYVEEILARKPDHVLECGSGLSTIWAAYALESVGSSGRVVALEHDGEFADQTRAQLAEHGLSAYADVRHAPLTELELSGRAWQWYDLSGLKDVRDVGVVLIDGPPKATAELARYPALPVLREHLAPGAVILADDTRRDDEQAILRRWLDEWPELECEELRHEKGAVRLRVPDL